MKKENCDHNKISVGYFEQAAWADGLYVCGVDEAGRGSLFGPMVVAAVILPCNTKVSFLKDSKIMTEAERNRAYEWIVRECFISYVIVEARSIDEHNIYQSTRIAMKKVFLQVMENFPFDCTRVVSLVSDAVPIDLPVGVMHAGLTLYNPTHAESISPSVAAASIVAKVFRDKLISRLELFFPAFSLAKHKGYGTSLHSSEIEKNGVSIIHRRTFISKFIEKSDYGKQKTIC